MMIIPVKFQPSRTKGLRGDRGDGQTKTGHHTVFAAIPVQIFNFRLASLDVFVPKLRQV